MRIAIIEDETAAAVNLASILAQVCPEGEIVCVLESIADSVSWFSENEAPQVVFLDIHLADGDAFRIFEKADIPCPIVFTTAYDRYALDAFRVNSIDYLLKPIKPDDVKRALDKLSRLTQADMESYAGRVAKAAEQSRQHTFLVRMRDKIIPVKSEDIAFFYTTNERVTIHTMVSKEYLYDRPLDHIMPQLPSAIFFRANRQFIVSRAAVKDISVWFGSRLALNLNMETPERIIVSKARVPELKRWLEQV